VFNLTVENPTTSPLIVMLRREDGVVAVVAVESSARLSIRFTKSLEAEFYPTNALTIVNPKKIG